MASKILALLKSGAYGKVDPADDEAPAPAAAAAPVPEPPKPKVVIHSEYKGGGSDDVTDDGKIRHNSVGEWVVGSNGHMYRHGSCWEESHSIPAAELKEGPGREILHGKHKGVHAPHAQPPQGELAA